jgi:uncharacterized protein (DUF433 family)
MAVEIKNGRINGTRITIYDVYQYLVSPHPFTRKEIAEILPLTPEELQAALDYIAANREQVHAVHLQIEERNDRGNSPQVEAMLVESRKRREAWLQERRRMKQEEEHRVGPARRP